MTQQLDPPVRPGRTPLPSSGALRAYRDAVNGVRDLHPADPDAAELVRLGLAVGGVDGESPALLRPVDPSRAMQLLVDGLSDGLADWNDRAGRIVGEIEQLGRNDLLFHRQAKAGLHVVPDRAAIANEVRATCAAAGQELLVLDAGLAALSGDDVLFEDDVLFGDDVLPDRRVPVRRTIRARPEQLTARDAGRDGEHHQRRVLSVAPFSMVIADRTRAIVPLDVTGECGAAVVRAPLLVAALATHFDMLWDRAVDIDGSSGVRDSLPPATLRVLRLLAAGFTDEEVAEQVHVTSRTVGRHVQTIIAATGARTRLEACAKAIRRGWID